MPGYHAKVGYCPMVEAAPMSTVVYSRLAGGVPYPTPCIVTPMPVGPSPSSICGPPVIYQSHPAENYDHKSVGTLCIASTPAQDFRLADIYANYQHWQMVIPMEDFEKLGIVANYDPIKVPLEHCLGPMERWPKSIYTDWGFCMKLLAGQDLGCFQIDSIDFGWIDSIDRFDSTDSCLLGCLRSVWGLSGGGSRAFWGCLGMLGGCPGGVD